MGQLGRDDLAVALKQAEDIVTRYLGFYLIPCWTSQEEHLVTKPATPELYNVVSYNARGQAKSIVANHGFVLEGGQRVKSLIEGEAAVIYSDEDSDGYDETATISVTTTVTDPQEIHVYFVNHEGSDKWEIRPISVTITGGVAVIVIPRYMLPRPELWTQEPLPGDKLRTINGDDIAQFVDSVDVYWVYNDPQSQAMFYKEGASCGVCGGTGCDACGWSTVTGCLRVRDSRRGILSYSPATWDSETSAFIFGDTCWVGDPDKIYIWYRSGLIDNTLDTPYLQMSPMWERAIVFYSLTLLDRNLNGCENTHNIWMMMNEDMAESDNGKAFQLTGRDVGNPLGTKRAAIRMWRQIETNRLLQGR